MRDHVEVFLRADLCLPFLAECRAAGAATGLRICYFDRPAEFPAASDRRFSIALKTSFVAALKLTQTLTILTPSQR